MVSDILKKYSWIGKGVASQMAPSIFKGFLKESLSDLTIKEVTGYVQSGKMLFDEMDENGKETLEDYAPYLGDLEWFNIDWFVTNFRHERPDLISLFLGWPEGMKWANKQIEYIRQHLTKE